jgi:signal transduction histidine kinase
VLSRKAPGEFSTQVIDLLTTFATQSALAIQNARLFRELKEKSLDLESLSGNMERLYRLSTALQEPLSLGEQLTRVLDAARQVVRLDRLHVWTVTPETDRLALGAGAGLTAQEWQPLENLTIPLAEAGALAAAYRQRAPLLFTDQNPLPPELRPRPPYSTLSAVRTKNLLVIPMIARGRPVGVLSADNRISREPIPPQTVDLLQTFAAQAAVAVENARLFQEIQDKRRELEVASRHKSQFVANMSHELRTPLNAIIGVTEMLLEDAQVAAQPDQIEAHERILRAGRHLLALINDILDLSKIEAGKLELSLESVPLAPLVEDVLATIRPLAAKNGNQVDVVSGRRGGDPGRPDATPPGAAQPCQQRQQVHRAGQHPDRGDPSAGRPRPRLGHHGGLGHGDRHDGRADGEVVRGLHPGRRLDDPQVRRDRPRSGDQPAPLPDDGWRHHRHERAWSGLHLRDSPPGVRPDHPAGADRAGAEARRAGRAEARAAGEGVGSGAGDRRRPDGP